MFISKANNPVLLVKNYLNNEEVIVLGKIFNYTEDCFEAIMKLDPFQRCSIIYNQLEINKDKTRFETMTKDEIIVKLTENGFYEELQKKQIKPKI